MHLPATEKELKLQCRVERCHFRMEHFISPSFILWASQNWGFRKWMFLKDSWLPYKNCTKALMQPCIVYLRGWSALEPKALARLPFSSHKPLNPISRNQRLSGSTLSISAAEWKRQVCTVCARWNETEVQSHFHISPLFTKDAEGTFGKVIKKAAYTQKLLFFILSFNTIRTILLIELLLLEYYVISRWLHRCKICSVEKHDLTLHHTNRWWYLALVF